MKRAASKTGQFNFSGQTHESHAGFIAARLERYDVESLKRLTSILRGVRQ